MKYRIDDEGKLHEIGDTIGRVGLTRPARYDSFSIGYALTGLLTGGSTGLAASILIKLVIAIYSQDAAFDFASFGLVAGQVFTPEFIFTVPVIVIAIISAVAGFFWDGFESCGEVFLVSLGFVGLILGGLIGLFLGTLVVIVLSVLDFPYLVMAKVLITALLAGGAVGFFWNGLESLREVFAVHRAFIGILCGLLRGIITCLVLLLNNGCLVIILAVVFSPLVIVAVSGVLLFYIFKGFFVIGGGGEWDDL